MLVVVEGGEDHHEVASRLILGMEVSVPLFVALLVLEELIERSGGLPGVEDRLLCSGPETCRSGSRHDGRDDAVSVGLLVVPIVVDSRALGECLGWFRETRGRKSPSVGRKGVKGPRRVSTGPRKGP